VKCSTAVRTPQHRDLEIVRNERAVGPGECRHRDRNTVGERQVVTPRRLDALCDLVRFAAEHAEPLLVHHGAVVQDVEQLVATVLAVAVPHLGHQDLDLEWLDLVGEDLIEDLRVRVRQTSRIDVLATEGIALQVRVTDSRDA
jgi:hypothetical protein